MTSHESQTTSVVRFWRGVMPIGESGRLIGLELRSNDEGLAACRISVAGEVNETSASPRDPDPEDVPFCPHLGGAVRQLEEYLRGDRRSFELPLSPEMGTPFQRAVWNACSDIPYGQTRSYWWTAVRAGNPYATRAVGSALGANPLPLFVPCHRVVRSDGSLGGFSADPGLKELLLGHELHDLLSGGLEV